MTTSTKTAVTVTNLCKTYPEGSGRRTILDNLEMSLQRGERVALVGRSGSGKSTLLNLLAGLDRPDSGSIEIGGVTIENLSEKERSLFRRRHVGFVFQSFQLLPTLTVEENVQLPLELIGARSQSDVQTMLEAVGMWRHRAAYPDRLSGGEQQRVAIARALIHKPTLILADEPTGSLDDENCTAVLDLLSELVHKTDCALLMATHSPEVAGQADRRVSLQHGRLVEDA
jgi:putative ABC transport system ATP-binding protein